MPIAPPRPTERPRTSVLIAAALLLMLHFALAVGSKRHESTTSDELVHLTGGLSYWRNHDYRLHPENGILPQRWAALPAWLEGARFPELAGNDYWRTSDAWVVGHQLFYETGEDHFPRLMAARAMIALFSVGTGLLVFCWSRKFFGDAGALVSLVFFTFSPDFLAHGALATSDACMTFFFLAATGAWWRHLHDPRASRWWLSALLLGLAFVAKYSAVVLLPVLGFTALVRAWNPAPLGLGRWTFTTRGGKIAAAFLSLAGHGAVVVAVIWTCYGFRYSAFNPSLPPADHFIRPWPAMIASNGTAGKIIDLAGKFHLLPEGFLYGFVYVLETVKMRAAFLNGEFSLTGWPSYFVWTFFLKTTLPLLLAGALVTGIAVRRWRVRGGAALRGDLYRVAPLAAFFAVYWILSLTSHLNIGHRHILPTYPVLFIAAGALGAWIGSRTMKLAVVAVALLGWQAGDALTIAPHYLAYFNELGGGPKNGRFHLVDSSLDWGQDLPGLKQWLAEKNPEGAPVFLSYFGTGEPAYYQLHAQRTAFVNNFKFPVAFVPLTPGIYCVSATVLAQVYSPFRGPWTLEYEKEYQRLRGLETILAVEGDPAARREFESGFSPAQQQALFQRYDQLRFARLSHYLRARRPDDNVGYSIWIFRLSADEIARATAGPITDWSALIEQAAAKPGG